MKMDANYLNYYEAPRTFDDELYDSIYEYTKPDELIELLTNNPEITRNQPISCEFIKNLVHYVVRSYEEQMIYAFVKFFESEAENDPQKQLILAIFKGDLDGALLLLKNGVSLEGGDWKGECLPAIHNAVLFHNNRVTKHMLNLLIKHGLDTKIKNDENQNLFHALSKNYQFYDEETVLEIAKIFYDSGLPVDEIDEHGLSPLQYAVKNNQDFGFIKFLTDKGADVNRKDKTGNNFSLCSCTWSNADLAIAELIISKGADVNVKESDTGRSALHEACVNSSEPYISLLLRNNADIAIEDDEGDTPFLKLRPSSRNFRECSIAMIKEISKIFFENHGAMGTLSSRYSEKDMAAILRNTESKEHLMECLKEIVEIVVSKFYPPYSYYHVLSISKNLIKLSKLARNEKFVAKFNKNLDLFSYYKEDLIRNFEKAIQVRNDSDVVLSRLRCIFKEVLPDFVISVLAESLNSEDLPLPE